jgi:hypothetical protein
MHNIDYEQKALQELNYRCLVAVSDLGRINPETVCLLFGVPVAAIDYFVGLTHSEIERISRKINTPLFVCRLDDGKKWEMIIAELKSLSTQVKNSQKISLLINSTKKG